MTPAFERPILRLIPAAPHADSAISDDFGDDGGGSGPTDSERIREDNRRLALCMKEIEIVQENIARYDQNGMKLKSGCVAMVAGILAYALEHQSHVATVATILVVIGFGFIEFTYRRFQRRFILRSAAIEHLLADGDLRGYRYSINSAATNVQMLRECRFVLTQPHFNLFYFPMLALTIFIVQFLG